MRANRFEKIFNNMNEYFSSAWILLSDTTIFLSNNTKIFHQFENQLRGLRRRLEMHSKDPEVIREVRLEVAEIRKILRLQGYNLKLGSLDLKLEGFRNDDSIARGFQRCVLYLMEDGDILYMTGSNNHMDLESALDSRLMAVGYRPISQKHYLWYKWANRVLLLSGSATETAEDFEEFKIFARNNKTLILKKLKKL